MSKERFISAVLHFLFAMLVAVFVIDVFGTKKPEPDTIEITFPAEDIRCVQQDGKIVFCESYKEEWR